jgi:DNA adenine methylase
MTDEQHVELLNTLIGCKSKVLLSGYDNGLYDILTENGWNKYSYEINTTDGKNRPKTKTEVLWFNYDIEK